MRKKKLHPAEQYAHDVTNGNIAACEWVKLACSRYFDDLKKKDLDYYFDGDHARLYIGYMEMLHFSQKEWAGKPFKLEPWQQFIIWNIFGWLKKSGGRRFTDVTINIPKKNGKTELSAAIALTVAVMDEVIAGQIYMVATAREQAALCFTAAKRMVEFSPNLSAYYNLLAHAIFLPKTKTTIKALSSEASTAEGKGSDCVIFDEEHEQVTSKLRDNLKSGMGASENRLFISISTAGVDRRRPYYSHLEVCKQILKGVATDDRHFIIIYAGSYEGEGNDKKLYDKIETWKKLNPNFGISKKADFMQEELDKVKNRLTNISAFLTKHLNIWTDAKETWIAHDVWTGLTKNISLDDFAGRECWMGLDLASSLDFTALAILFPLGASQEIEIESGKDNNGDPVIIKYSTAEKFAMFWLFWIPEDDAQKRALRDHLDFRAWAAAGHITLTEGNVTDYTKVRADIIKLSRRFNIKSISYDPANASELVTNLTGDGIQMDGYSQGVMNTNVPTKAFARYVHSGCIDHDGNPVMTWMMGNVWAKEDANGNIKINKGKSTNKVDGPVASVNAIGKYLTDMANPKEQYFVG